MLKDLDFTNISYIFALCLLIKYINFIILLIVVKLLVCEKSVFYGIASELSHFLFMYYAIEFVLMAFKASQERYLPFGGITYHLKDFNALERKI